MTRSGVDGATEERDDCEGDDGGEEGAHGSELDGGAEAEKPDATGGMGEGSEAVGAEEACAGPIREPRSFASSRIFRSFASPIRF